MQDLPYLRDLTVVAGVAVLAAVVLGRLRVPVVAGLLAAGAVAGPHGLGVVGRVETIEALAEIGVVLLLFTIGLEFSLARLRFIAREVVLGGTLQVGLTTAAAAAVSVAFGASLAQGVLLGYVFALSSTAIVLRGLAERGELDAPHGRLIVGALIFQDLCVVPMMLTVPLLAGAGGNPGAIASALGKAVLVVGAAAALARVLVPRLFAGVDASGSREVFLLAVMALCLGTAWVTSRVGLSLALGAFLAGLLLADTDYGHRAMSEVLPLRDLFASVFFVSLGMLFDARFIASSPLLVGALFGGFVLAKGFLATVAAVAIRFPARVAWLVGVGLAQFGEFGFVLVVEGQRAGLLSPELTGPLLAAGVLSMFVTPVAARIAPRVSAGERLLAPLERLLRAQGMDEPEPEHRELSDHVVIAGYGLGGRLLTRALDGSGIAHVVLELNAELVREGRERGAPLYYGDVTSVEALRHARLESARALVVLIHDTEATRRAVAAARHLAPRVPIYLRTRYLADADRLTALGASEIVSEELEAATEMAGRILRAAGLPDDVAAARLADARSGMPPAGSSREGVAAHAPARRGRS